jgi:threonine dehydrogenase-like Zn-dependent dehydrogenase
MSLSESLELSVVTRDFPDPKKDEVRIRVAWAGVCGSDLHVIRTGDWVEAWPAVLGHEIYGHVEALGTNVERDDLRKGTPVVVDSRYAVDDVGTTFVGEACEGGFAEYCVLPQRLLLTVPDELEGEVAVLAEPLAVVLAAAPDALDRALILGHGPVGALAHVELRRRNPDLTISVAEPNGGRRELAHALGAVTESSAQSFSTGRYDLVIDSAGYPGSLGDAAQAATPNATVRLC